MKPQIALVMAAGLALAACEKEKGVGFTGIGQVSSQSLQPGYALDFDGLTWMTQPATPEPDRMY